MRISLMLAAILCLCAACGTVPPPPSARTYCNELARSENSLFLPVYPPQQGIGPNAVLELNLPKGPKTQLARCVSFTPIADGDDTPVSDRALLPTIAVETSAEGTIDLGATASVHIPVDVIAKAGAQASRTVQLTFDGVRRHKARSPRRIIADTDDGQVLDAKVCDPAEYIKRIGAGAREGSLWFFRVDEVYLADAITWSVEVRSARGAQAEISRVAAHVRAATGTEWKSLGRSSLVHTEPFDPPIVIAAKGTLYEISSRDGKLLTYRRFPLGLP